MAPVKMSIIIVSQPPAELLRDCLESLAGEMDEGVEVIVAHAGARLREDLLAAVPDADVVAAPPTATVPELRFAGLERASGDLVAMTESAARFTPGWLQELRRRHAEGYDAVGGAIDPDGDLDLTSWAAHLCEYGAYMSPLEDREGGDFSGFHACYRRSLLEACVVSLRERHWETVLHVEARAAGGRFLRCGALRLVNARRHRIGSFLRQRLAYGRGYGGVRARRIPAAAHLALLVATPLLPALMLFRYVRWMVRKRLSIPRCVTALPLLLLFATAWSAGEWMGYASAVPGRLRSDG